MYRKKYSYNERVDFHKSRYKSFVDKFRYSPEPGVSNIHFDELEKATKKNKSMQYSSGFIDAVNNFSLDEKATMSERAGYNAAKKAFEKAKSIKY